MNKIILLTVLAACTFCFITGCTKEKHPPDRILRIIIDNYYVDEPNPLYLAETSEINELFRYSLTNRNTLKPGERRKIYSRAVALYKASDAAELEDAVDGARMMMRKSVSLATAALVAVPEEALKLLESSKEALTTDRIADEFMEEDYAALLLLEIFYLSEHKMLRETTKETAIVAINNSSNLTETSKYDFIEVIRGM